jgi:hypothetical protein
MSLLLLRPLLVCAFANIVASQTVHSGAASWYYADKETINACSQPVYSTTYQVALPLNVWQSACGHSVKVTIGSKTVIAPKTDQCPQCTVRCTSGDAS